MLGLEHAPHRTAIYRSRKKLSEEYVKELNRRILERLNPAAKELGADATGLRQSKQEIAWSSTSRNGRRDCFNLHGFFSLETNTLEAFEITASTSHECRLTIHQGRG
jgi:hypothetical protein